MKTEYLVSAKEMQQYDSNTIEKIKIPSCVLMERAAYAIAMEALTILTEIKSPRVLVVAGNGNNGADGVCAGRILAEYGIPTDICLLKDKPPYSEELQKQLSIASHYKIRIISVDTVCFSEYNLIIDSIFGIGLNREITGQIKEVITQINMSDAHILSVDIPSGIDSSSGKVLGCAINADTTVTFGFYKKGQWFYPGRAYCGNLIKAKIAINETGFFGEIPHMFTYMPDNLGVIDLSRNPMGNKGTFGKVFVIAGRNSTTGAAILCATSALRSGCGMVAVFTEQENKEVFLQTAPEIMVETYTLTESKNSIRVKMEKWMEWADCIVIGCGLLQDETAYDMTEYVLTRANKPIVCDADALQLIAKNSFLQEAVAAYTKRNDHSDNVLVFTPHPGELSALANCSIAKIKEDKETIITQTLEKYPVILIAKDADTIVCQKDKKWYLNITGNDGLSTAGSGDVLAGLVASILSQNRKKEITSFESVCLSVFIHGLTADILAKETGKSFLVASDLIEAYKYILK